MTSDSAKPSEGAMRVANELVPQSIHELLRTKLVNEYAAPFIDREAVAPAVKPLVEALATIVRLADSGYWTDPVGCQLETTPHIDNVRAALEPWRHLLDKSEG